MLGPKPLFIIGNKRSGTTLVTDLLNSHPNVFVSHEADIAWILFQARMADGSLRDAPFGQQTDAGFNFDVPRARKIMEIYGYCNREAEKSKATHAAI